jgi:hypothetical protein
VEQNKNIPPGYAIRLDDLRAWHAVFCDLCNLPKADPASTPGCSQHGRAPYTRSLDLERKLRCTSCGNQHGNGFSVSMAPRN